MSWHFAVGMGGTVVPFLMEHGRERCFVLGGNCRHPTVPKIMEASFFFLRKPYAIGHPKKASLA